MWKFVLLVIFTIVLNVLGDYVSEWHCETIVKRNLGSGVDWIKLNCSGEGIESSWLPPFDQKWKAGPMIFNVIDVDLTAPGVNVRPGIADSNTPYKLQTLPDMAKNIPKALAGINGGYFWRLDSSEFVDGVCLLKTRYDAEQPVNTSYPNYGVGDSLLIVDGKILSCNCDIPSYEVPTALVLNGTFSSIEIMTRGGTLPIITQNAIAAGPNLVSFDFSSNLPYVNIPWDDFNVNIWEHAANTAVGLVAKENNPNQYVQLFMVTADGYDGCPEGDPTCGIEAKPMAYFLKDYLMVTVAMEMDQGGSTTMWVNGEGKNGVVSNSDNRNPVSSPRALFDGLFVTIE